MGTETLVLLAALSCSGLCCLGVAVVLLGGVLYAMSSAQSEGGGSLPWPFASSEPAHSQPVVEPSMAQPYAPEPEIAGMAPAVEQPAFGGDEPLGAPIDPHAPPRSSGQTIIAFDDDEDDWQ